MGRIDQGLSTETSRCVAPRTPRDKCDVVIAIALYSNSYKTVFTGVVDPYCRLLPL
jgi:hypothetical protein